MIFIHWFLRVIAYYRKFFTSAPMPHGRPPSVIGRSSFVWGPSYAGQLLSFTKFRGQFWKNKNFAGNNSQNFRFWATFFSISECFLENKRVLTKEMANWSRFHHFAQWRLRNWLIGKVSTLCVLSLNITVSRYLNWFVWKELVNGFLLNDFCIFGLLLTSWKLVLSIWFLTDIFQPTFQFFFKVSSFTC